jgi:glycerophosphoryl diester phosphodiesterase
VLQSFNIPLLFLLDGCSNPIIQLYDKDIQITEEMLTRNANRNVIGIGITEGNLLNIQGMGENRVGEICSKLSYCLFYWTVRDDDGSNIPFKCASYFDVYKTLLSLGVTGFITEFPDKCKAALNIPTPLYVSGNAETQTSKS